MLSSYNLKKIVPRLVAAVVLIQLSWVLSTYAVSLANDIGRSLSTVMYAPFPDNIDDITVALGKVGGAGVEVSAGVIFAGGVGLAVLSGISVLGLIILAVPVLLAVAIGWFVLVLRQILVIMCVLFFPFALLAWVLPGTERYWKMFKDNFLKLLLMYPMIVGLIAAGRIFGYVGASAGGVAGFCIVLIGFFGPLLILPKTFQWGGAALGAMGGAVINGTKKYRSMPRDWALAGAKTNREQRRQDRLGRLYEGTSRRPRLDRLLAGGGNITLNAETRRRRLAQAVAQGKDESAKAFALEMAASDYRNLTHPEKVEELVAIARGEIGRASGIDGSNPVARRHALNELAKFGDWDRIGRMRAEEQVDDATWQSFVAENISGIHQNLPWLSPQRQDPTQTTAEELVSGKDISHEMFADSYENGYVFNSDGSRRRLSEQEHAQFRERAVRLAHTMVNDDQLRRRLSPAAQATYERIASEGFGAGSEVRVESLGRGHAATPQVILPASLGTSEAQESVVSHLIQGPQQATVSRELVARAIAAPAGSDDEAHIGSIMSTLRSQAPASPQAAQAHNAVLEGINSAVEQRVLDVQRATAASSASAAEIDASVTREIRNGVEKIDRLNLGDRI